MTLPSPDSTIRFHEIEFRILDYEDDNELFTWFLRIADRPEVDEEHGIVEGDFGRGHFDLVLSLCSSRRIE